MRLISGMVNVPVVMTFAVDEPEIVPNMALVMQATLAGPPAVWPASAMAKSMNSLPVPDFSTRAPNTMNSTMYVAETLSGMPSTPSVVRYIWSRKTPTFRLAKNSA